MRPSFVIVSGLLTGAVIGLVGMRLWTDTLGGAIARRSESAPLALATDARQALAISRSGEPPLGSSAAREIQALIEREGSVLDGTDFGAKASEQQENRAMFASHVEELLGERDSNLMPALAAPSSADALRSAARQLDAEADRLESARKYDEADLLRAQAQRLRTESRALADDPAKKQTSQR